MTAFSHIEPRASQWGARSEAAGAQLSYRQFAPAPERAAVAARETTASSQPRNVSHQSAHSFASCAIGDCPVQRKTYLDNPDDNIYKDSDNDALELAFLGSGGTPLFVDYGALMKVVVHVERAWGRIPAKTRRDLYANDIENYAKNHHFALNTRRIKRIGKIYAEGLDGVLVEHGDATSNIESLVAVVGAVARKGPLYRNVGGGSRLPTPSGYLVSRALSLEDSLRALGIDDSDFGKYAAVEFHQVSEKMMTFYKGLAATGEENAIDGGDCVYFSTVQPRRSANARFRADGANYDENFSQVPPDSEEEATLKTAFERLPTPTSSGWVAGTRLTKTDRGEGQARAMNDWNALGAAAFANKYYGTTYSLSQNWEWLHLQGAQIGGETVGGNLAAGLFVVNSRMIPYENLIAQWANNSGDTMWARFSPGGTMHSLTDRISLEVVAEDHPQLGTLATSHPLQIDFSPTSGRVVDKLMGRLQERNLDRTPIVAPTEY